MKKIIIFGAGDRGRRLYKVLSKPNYRKNVAVVEFFDNYENGDVNGVNIVRPYSPDEEKFDYIIITNNDGCDEIYQEILNLGINKNKIKILNYMPELLVHVLAVQSYYNENTDPRVFWLRLFAQYVREENISGNVAEAGVNRGDFAEYINRFFPDRKLFLFDTFEGFDDKDIKFERGIGDNSFLCGQFNNGYDFKSTGQINEYVVKERMPYLDQCVIKKGYFPATTKDIDDSFVFVNLDMDLYKPMLAGLQFFFPRMVKNGVILLHDYFCKELPGVRKAVKEYSINKNLHLTVIGDSIAVIR